jgi:hypothetical protein
MNYGLCSALGAAAVWLCIEIFGEAAIEMLSGLSRAMSSDAGLALFFGMPLLGIFLSYERRHARRDRAGSSSR